MNYITPDKYINSVINENDISKMIDVLTDKPSWNIYDRMVMKEDTQYYIDWLQYYLEYATKKNTDFLNITVNMKKDMKLLKGNMRKYEKSLWDISSYKYNDSWLTQLYEKNRRIDQLEEELLCHKKSSENYKTMEEIYDHCFLSYVYSLNQQIIESKQEITFLKDIKESMIRHAGHSEKVASSKDTEESMKDHARMFKTTQAQMDKDNENDKNDEAMNNKSELMNWDYYLSTLIKGMRTTVSPIQYYVTQTSILKNKEARLINMMNVLNDIKNTNDRKQVYSHLKTLVILANNYANALRIQLFTTIYNLPVKRNEKIISILNAQTSMFKDTVFNYKDEYPHTVLDERNHQVIELEEQYAKLTKSGECTQDQIAVLNENLMKYTIEIEAVRDKCERLMEKHENELKIAMSNTKTNTPHTAEKECPIEVEKQQTGKLSNEQKTNDETKAQCSKDDQTNAESQEENSTPNLFSSKFREYYLWQLKCKNRQWKEEIHYMENKIKVYKDFLNNLMRNGGIDEIDASLEKKKAESGDNLELEDHQLLKILFYYSLEQAECIQNIIQRSNAYYNDLLKEHVANNTYVKNHNNPSKLQCDTCSFPIHKLSVATDFICNISQDITKLSATFHMLPFKNFFEAISGYIMTEKKVDQKRRKLEMQAKQMKKLIRLAKKQKLLDSLDNKHADPLTPNNNITENYLYSPTSSNESKKNKLKVQIDEN